MVLESSTEFADTHCHLNFDDFKVDRLIVLQRSKENGITRILVPGIDIETSRSAIECAKEVNEVYAAVGVHPNQGVRWTKATLSNLRELAREKKVVAIGEIGLDYFRDRTPKSLQRSIFEEQLKLAAEVGLPVIIHNREASEDILKIVQNWYRELKTKESLLTETPGVMHAFSGDAGFADEMISMKFKIGIAGPLTFKKSQLLQSIVYSHPIRDFVVETDAPYLTPHPYRGKRNEPANVRIVAEKISELKSEAIETVAGITSVEADKLFRWRDIN